MVDLDSTISRKRSREKGLREHKIATDEAEGEPRRKRRRTEHFASLRTLGRQRSSPTTERNVRARKHANSTDP